MIAGPSEILIIYDGKTNSDWIAMDLFSQAEHDEDAQSILLNIYMARANNFIYFWYGFCAISKGCYCLCTTHSKDLSNA
jgi:hypothetical protein